MIRIMCEAIIRANEIIKDASQPEFKMLRLENGLMIASNRRLLTVEKLLTDFQGLYHITLDDDLIKQCRDEIQFSGMLEIVPNDALQFTVGKTTMGYQTQNIGCWPGKSDLDRWREVIGQCVEPLPDTRGTMVWNCQDVTTLITASPSGCVVFEDQFHVDDRPILIRDSLNPHWCGCFMPRTNDGKRYSPARYPEWLK